MHDGAVYVYLQYNHSLFIRSDMVRGRNRRQVGHKPWLREKQVQDITNHHIEWDWFSCDTTSIPICDRVTKSSVEGKGPSCKCAYGKCCGSRDAEANDRCFKNDGKTTCSIGSKLACCCESSVVEDALEDELGAQDGPFLRVKID